MRKCIKIVILLLILLFIAFAIFEIKKTTNIKTEENIESTEDIYEIEKKYHELEKLYEEFDKSRYDNVVLLVEKNGDWSKIPLSDNFRNKYNEKDGVLGKEIEFDEVEYCPYETGNYGFIITSYFVITRGKEKIAYNFSYEFTENQYGNSVIDNIELSDPIVFVDENGNEIDTRMKCDTIENWDFILTYIDANDPVREQAMGITEKFYTKYDNFQDAMSKKLNQWEDGYCTGFIENDFDTKTVTCNWKCDGVKHKVKFKFVLDEKNFIDDIEILEQ